MMINRIISILLVLLSICCQAQVKRNTIYRTIYGKGQPDYTTSHTRKLFAHIISDKQNSIPEAMVGNITVVGNFNLKGYGKSELIKVELKNPPSVLQNNFLVIVNHNREEISAFNVDYYYLVKGNLKDSSKTIVVLNYIRGEIDFNSIDCKGSNLTLSHPQIIYSNNNCKKIKPNLITLTNVDINHDGLADILLKFTELNYCDKDGNDNENPISNTEITISLVYNRTIGNWRQTHKND